MPCDVKLSEDRAFPRYHGPLHFSLHRFFVLGVIIYDTRLRATWSCLALPGACAAAAAAAAPPEAAAASSE